jgi:CBS domain containing-hemolysin-like protein
MDTHALLMLLLKILAVVALVLMNGVFVATEFALVKIRDTQLQPLIAKGDRRARLLRHITHHLDAFLSAAQLGITLASLALGWIGEPIFEALLQPVFRWLAIDSPRAQHTIAFAVGFTVITFLHIVAGEQAPKSFGIRQPLNTALWIAYPLRWFYFIAYPFIWVLNESSLALLRALGITPVPESGAHSEEEFRLMLSAGAAGASAGAFGRSLVLNAFDLRQRVARQVMRPRREIILLDTRSSLAECIDVAESTRYSRFPLCKDGDINRTLGVVHIKDLYAARHTAKTGADLASVAHKIVFIPETARLEKVLELLQQRQLHFALVVDEFGDTLGLVTLENVLEEIVGQIQDEFDQEKPLLQKTAENTWEIDGALPLHELSDLVGEPIAAEGVTTTSGFVTVKLEGFPHEDDTVPIGQFSLRVIEMTGPRVARLKLERRAEPPPQQATAGH